MPRAQYRRYRPWLLWEDPGDSGSSGRMELTMCVKGWTTGVFVCVCVGTDR